jgi:hypothetical protein
MPKNIHTATIDGRTFTRTSASRVYTHCVAIRTLLTNEHKNKIQAAEREEQQAAEYLKAAERGFVVVCGRRYPETAETFRNRADDCARRSINLRSDARKIAARIEAGEKYASEWVAATWCGRLDLAQKEAARRDWCETRILETTVVVK